MPTSEIPLDDRDSVTDEELARRVQKGDRSAFEVLVRRYERRVYAVAYRFTGRREDARDVAQDAFVKAYRHIAKWRPTGSFQAWLLRLTTNQAIDHTRSQKRHRRGVSLEVLDGNDEPVAPETAGADARRHEIDARVQEALAVLSPAQRTVFVLRHFEQLSLAEIAPVLGCSVGSVKVHLFRALRKLRDELRDLEPGADTHDEPPAE